MNRPRRSQDSTISVLLVLAIPNLRPKLLQLHEPLQHHIPDHGARATPPRSPKPPRRLLILNPQIRHTSPHLSLIPNYTMRDHESKTHTAEEEEDAEHIHPVRPEARGPIFFGRRYAVRSSLLSPLPSLPSNPQSFQFKFEF